MQIYAFVQRKTMWYTAESSRAAFRSHVHATSNNFLKLPCSVGVGYIVHFVGILVRQGLIKFWHPFEYLQQPDAASQTQVRLTQTVYHWCGFYLFFYHFGETIEVSGSEVWDISGTQNTKCNQFIVSVFRGYFDSNNNIKALRGAFWGVIIWTKEKHWGDVEWVNDLEWTKILGFQHIVNVSSEDSSLWGRKST